MVITTCLCDKCLELGLHQKAGYALLAEEEALSGAQRDNSLDNPLRLLRWHMLCVRHHEELDEELQTAYVPLYQ